MLQVAKKMLSIPCSSAPCERLFSAAADVISQDRNRLLPQNARRLIVLKANLRLLGKRSYELFNDHSSMSLNESGPNIESDKAQMSATADAEILDPEPFEVETDEASCSLFQK